MYSSRVHFHHPKIVIESNIEPTRHVQFSNRPMFFKDKTFRIIIVSR